MAAVHPARRQPVHRTATNDQRRQAGLRLRAARQLAGVSLADTARSAGLTLAHVSAVDRGKHPMTTTDARDLATVLGCPENWLRHGPTDERA